MKRWRILLFLLLVAISCVLLYKRTVLPWPYPVRTFEFSVYGWGTPAVPCIKNEKGEMVCVWWDGHYIYSSNTVTGVETKERRRK